jgi:hypothetical protein
MRRLAVAFAAFCLSSLPVLAADGVPVFNVKPTCEAGGIGAVSSAQSHLDACLQSESAARDQLKQSWAGFLAGDRIECTGTAKIGPPSYVDLLTCLEMRRDARQPQQETTGSATGSATGLPRRQPTPASILQGGRL